MSERSWPKLILVETEHNKETMVGPDWGNMMEHDQPIPVPGDILIVRGVRFRVLSRTINADNQEITEIRLSGNP